MASNIGGILDRAPEQVFQHFSGALEKMKAMQPNKPGTMPTNKNARNAIWNKLIALDKPEMHGILTVMAEKAGHKKGEASMCDLCRFLAERMPAPEAK